MKCNFQQAWAILLRGAIVWRYQVQFISEASSYCSFCSPINNDILHRLTASNAPTEYQLTILINNVYTLKVNRATATTLAFIKKKKKKDSLHYISVIFNVQGILLRVSVGCKLLLKSKILFWGGGGYPNPFKASLPPQRSSWICYKDLRTTLKVVW